MVTNRGARAQDVVRKVEVVAVSHDRVTDVDPRIVEAGGDLCGLADELGRLVAAHGDHRPRGETSERQEKRTQHGRTRFVQAQRIVRGRPHEGAKVIDAAQEHRGVDPAGEFT
jgi:hypothetical protein